MLKISEQRQRRQARKIAAQFDRVVKEMRCLGEKAGTFAEASRAPGQTFTPAQIAQGAQAFVNEALASVAAPFAGLRAAGVSVDITLDEAALRSAFLGGFCSAVSPAALAGNGPGVAWDAATADRYAVFIAAAMARGCQPGRLFTAAEIDAAAETVCAPCECEGPYSDIADGMPPDIKEAAASLGPVAFRARVRRGLLASLPPSILDVQGTA